MMNVKNQFDPKLTVKIVDVTKGVPPDVLSYNLKDKERSTLFVEPNFEEFGDPIYEVPRFYAERLLSNCGGRIFKLVSPTKLLIRVPNGRGGTDFKELVACKKRGDGEWHELTDEELEAAEKGEKLPSKPDLGPDEILNKPVKPKREPGMSKKATRGPTAPKAPKKIVTEKDDDSLESLLGD
jgi:hypothetical protein